MRLPTTMPLYLMRWMLGYMLLAAMVGFVVQGDPFWAFGRIVESATTEMATIIVKFGYFVFVPIVAIVILRPRKALPRLIGTLVAFICCCVFLASFTTIKGQMPFLTQMVGLPPFHADPAFAVLDRVLHFGVDPWRMTHGLTEALNWDWVADYVTLTYGFVWAVPAFCLPAILIFMGESQETQRRYILLYAFNWIVMGNILATIFLSAGPIYYDRLFGGETFTLLAEALHSSGMTATRLGEFQERLWEDYTLQDHAVGSGISAFPSLHLATTTLFAIYLAEKSKWLAPLGIAFVIVILFLSVWVGYHYAIDGYFSIIVVLLANRSLKQGFLRRLVRPEPCNASSQLTQRPLRG